MEARTRGLDNLIQAISGRRNLRGVKNKVLREQIEASMHKNLERAEGFAGTARMALVAGEIARYEKYLDAARIEWLIALNKLKNPFAKKADRRNALNAEMSLRARGSAEKSSSTKNEDFSKYKDLDGLIRSAIQRRIPFAVEAWVEELRGRPGFSRAAIYRRIAHIKKEGDN